MEIERRSAVVGVNERFFVRLPCDLIVIYNPRTAVWSTSDQRARPKDQSCFRMGETKGTFGGGGVASGRTGQGCVNCSRPG